jgi:hypothetical protein
MLVDRRHRTQILALSALTAVLALVAAATTLLRADMYTGRMPSELVLGSLGFDAMSVLISLALLLVLAGIRVGHDRWWLFWTGLQGYLLYAFALYAFGLVFTPIFLLYVAIVGASAFALALFWRSVNPHVLEHVRLMNAARRTMGGALLAISSLFAVAWVVMLTQAIALAVEVPAGTVIVLDLAFTLPLLAVVGVLLLRKRPVGYLLAPGAFGLSAAITLGVAFGEFMRPLLGDEFAWRTTVPYLAPGLICFGFSWMAFLRISRTVPRRSEPHPTTASTPNYMMKA